MYYQLKTTHGCIAVVIDDNCGISKFYAIATTLALDLQVNLLTQMDNADTLDWDFNYRGLLLTLHYNIFNGVSIFPQPMNNNKQNNNAAMEVAHFLERKLY